MGGGRRVIVIGDNAKHHHAWREPYAAHFALDFLPPCNPEIGPDQAGVEAHAPTNRYFQTLEDVIAAVEEQFGARAPPRLALNARIAPEPQIPRQACGTILVH